MDQRNDYNMIRQKIQHDHAQLKEFEIGETAWVKRCKEDKKFVQTVVKERTGPLSYIVIQDGIERRVHADQMRKAGGGGVTP
ncbi:Hypothetical protein NTJ_12311 [Nesidiocoris tenuis]|nr:Hypothetical protein NTJ_12311 [Nesidiocoris tenuis]